jgi:hypothetical protein
VVLILVVSVSVSVSVSVLGSVTPIDCRRNSPLAIFGRYLRFYSPEPWRSNVPMLYI